MSSSGGAHIKQSAAIFTPRRILSAEQKSALMNAFSQAVEKELSSIYNALNVVDKSAPSFTISPTFQIDLDTGTIKVLKPAESGVQQEPTHTAHGVVRPSEDFNLLYECSPMVLNGKLAVSAGYGDEKDVLRWLEYGARADASDSHALRNAAANGQTPMVKLLMKRGADVHALGDEALVLAAEDGHIGAVSFLLQQNPGQEARNEALRRAKKNQDRWRGQGIEEVIDLLVENGASREAPQSISSPKL